MSEELTEQFNGIDMAELMALVREIHAGQLAQSELLARVERRLVGIEGCLIGHDEQQTGLEGRVESLEETIDKWLNSLQSFLEDVHRQLAEIIEVLNRIVDRPTNLKS